MEAKQILFSVGAGLLIFFVMVHFLKKSRIYPSYVILWFSICGFLLSMPLLGDFYRDTASLLFGIRGGDHFLYIVFIGFLLLYSLYLTVKICSLTSQMSKIISTVAVIDAQHKLKKRDGVSK